MFDLVKVAEILESIKNEPSEAYESEIVEFKAYESKKAFYNKSQDIAAELTAFANKFGGLLIVGVKDSCNVVNMDWPSQLEGFEAIDCLEVNKRIRGNLNPTIPIDTMNYEFEGKNFLLIYVAKSNFGLVMTASGKCYMRSGRDSNPMSPQEVADKIKSSSGYDWSSEIMDSVDIEEALDDQQIEEVMIEYKNLNGVGESAIPQEHFLEKIGVTSCGKLTKGGLLFLGKPQVIKSLIGNIEYRFSKRESGGRLPINEVWSGSIWEAIARITELLKQVIEYDEFVCDDKTYTFPNICKRSFEEGLINSLIHRDYALDGLTTVELDENSVTFINPGDFYGGVTSSNIFTHPPRHRNPALASILMKFELVDRAGMGTRRMNIESLRLGRREPEFHSVNNCIATSLELGTVKEGIFVIASPFEDYDVAELFLINLLYGKGYEEISSVLEKIRVVVTDPWRKVNLALSRITCLSLVGNKNGIFMVVNDSHSEALNAYRKIKTFSSSDAYVSIYKYLYNSGEATSNELFGILDLDSLAKTQRLLREATFIEKIQNDTDVTWRLASP